MEDDKTQKKTQGEKKERECNFLNVADPSIKKQLKEAIGCPEDASHFTFWVRKADPSKWGLTVKACPKSTIQYVWKYTWYFEDDKLLPAAHCRTVARSVEGEKFAVVKCAYDVYTK
jgi:hypothetical protein